MTQRNEVLEKFTVGDVLDNPLTLKSIQDKLEAIDEIDERDYEHRDRIIGTSLMFIGLVMTILALWITAIL